MRKSGDYTLEELTSDIDGSLAYQVPETGQDAAIAGSWEAANTDLAPGITWVVEPEEDDLEISISPAYLASLVSRARAYDRIMALCVHAPRCECE